MVWVQDQEGHRRIVQRDLVRDEMVRPEMAMPGLRLQRLPKADDPGPAHVALVESERRGDSISHSDPIPHPRDSLAVLWERMDAGWAALVRGSGWIADKQTFGLRGYFRATEVVHNPLAGWNVHFHVILLLDVPLDLFHLYVLKDSTSNRFAHGVARKGGVCGGNSSRLAAGDARLGGAPGGLLRERNHGANLKRLANSTRHPR